MPDYYDSFKNDNIKSWDSYKIGMINSHASALEDMINKWTGNGLTSAQIEQNNFNAWQASISRDWQERMSNTAYQRQVKDMQAAGVNPALMYGNGSSGASTPSGATATAGSNDNGMSFQEMLSSLMLPFQLAQAKANIDLTKANAAKAVVDTEGSRLENEWRNRTLDARVESVELGNRLSEAEIGQVNESKKLITENIQKVVAETANEHERKFLIQSEKLVNDANAKRLVELLPYEKLLKESETDQAKANALSATIHAMYEKRMIDAGYIETMLEVARTNAAAALTGANAQKQMAEINAALGDFKNRVFRGNSFDLNNYKGKVGRALAQGMNALYSSISRVMTAVGGPLSGFLPK